MSDAAPSLEPGLVGHVENVQQVCAKALLDRGNPPFGNTPVRDLFCKSECCSHQSIQALDQFILGILGPQKEKDEPGRQNAEDDTPEAPQGFVDVAGRCEPDIADQKRDAGLNTRVAQPFTALGYISRNHRHSEYNDEVRRERVEALRHYDHGCECSQSAQNAARKPQKGLPHNPTVLVWLTCNHGTPKDGLDIGALRG